MDAQQAPSESSRIGAAASDTSAMSGVTGAFGGSEAAGAGDGGGDAGNGGGHGLQCGDFAASSPEGAGAAWCGRFRIHLDREGRFCRRCRDEEAFRVFLRRQYVLRFGPDCAGGRSFCEVFGVVTTERQCERCATDGLYRSFLRGQGTRRRDWRRCAHRGEVVRHETRLCCGGKTREIAFFACAVRGQAQEADCGACALVLIDDPVEGQDARERSGE